MHFSFHPCLSGVFVTCPVIDTPAHTMARHALEGLAIDRDGDVSTDGEGRTVFFNMNLEEVRRLLASRLRAQRRFQQSADRIFELRGGVPGTRCA